MTSLGKGQLRLKPEFCNNAEQLGDIPKSPSSGMAEL